MTQNKTVQTDASVDEFIASIAHPTRRQDAAVLVDLFSKVTGFSSRKSNLSIYIMPGYGDFSDILKNLGKHKLGKSCLYVNKLVDIDLDVLAQLITAGLERLDQIWPVRPS